MAVRPAMDTDLDAVVETFWSVAAEGRWIGTEVPFDREKRKADLRASLHSDAACLLVAEHEGRVIGHIGVRIAPYGVADIGMAIIDGYRGQGVGTQLLESAITWARDAGAHKMALEVWPHNDAGIALYRKLGFETEGRKRRHYRRGNGELWDSILMGLPLRP